MKVHIRERLGKEKGIRYLYLEIYKGYNKSLDGKIKANRERRKLDYFLYDNPQNPSQKAHNKDVKRKVEAIKGQVLNDLLNNKYGFKSEGREKVNFVDYFRKLANERYESKGNYGNWDSTLKHIIRYKGDSIPFEMIDNQFCKGFKEFLISAKNKNGRLLSSSSASSYYSKFRACLNQAVEDGVITINPARNIPLPRIEENKREFLNEDEVRKLLETECRYEVLKRAFLFSCLTGLRWSDVQKLEWNDIEKEGDKWKVVFRQKKTKELQYHYIPDNAIKFLGDNDGESERIFVGLKYSAYMNTALSQWVLRAGITKNITFHCARHTYATLLLTKGADLYTVSKLLGHKEVKTTQVYANIIDQKKIDAVSKLDIL